jgi:hypothetical protein
MANVWDYGPSDPIDNSVLLRLANFCDDEGKNCFPSIADTARAIRRSERTVTRSIVQLEAAGWLTVERGSGRNRSQYQINVERLQGCHAVTPDSVTGDSHDTPGLTATTTRGDSDDKPPYPLKGVSISDPSKEPSAGTPEDFMAAWNLHLGSLALIRKLTASRHRQVRARMREGITLEKFTQCLQLCSSSPFLMGNNERGWNVDFDWLVKNDFNILKVLEGKYRAQKGKPDANSNRNAQRSHGNLAELESFAREAGMDFGAIDGTGRSASGLDQCSDDADLFRPAG